MCRFSDIVWMCCWSLVASFQTIHTALICLSLIILTKKSRKYFNVSARIPIWWGKSSFWGTICVRFWLFTFKSKELKLIAFSAVEMFDRFFALNPFFQLALEFSFVEDCPFFEQLDTLFPIVFDVGNAHTKNIYWYLINETQNISC